MACSAWACQHGTDHLLFVELQVVFTWTTGSTEGERRELATGACVKVYGSEAAMLLAWHAFFDQADPDAIPVFQVRPSIPTRWSLSRVVLNGQHQLHCGCTREPVTASAASNISI